jgi:GNAT superfamily N-acetyltransferase
MSTSVVRHCTPADEPALIEMFITFHREGIWRQFPYNYGKLVACIQTATLRKGGIIGVIDAPDRKQYIAGIISLLLDTWWWSDCAFLQMREFYVRQEYRAGTGYAVALMKFAEDCRRQIDVARPAGHPPVLLESSFVSGEDPRHEALMARLWRRFGRRVGGVFISGL